MAQKKVSNVSFMPAIDGISRKLALRRETCIDKIITKSGASKLAINGHIYMGVVSRNVNIAGVGPVIKNTLFMRKPMAAHIPSDNELAARTKFTQVNAWVRDALEDLSAVTYNETQWTTCLNEGKTCQGVSPRGYQTVGGWMKGVAYAMLAAGSSLPENHKVPQAA